MCFPNLVGNSIAPMSWRDSRYPPVRSKSLAPFRSHQQVNTKSLMSKTIERRQMCSTVTSPFALWGAYDILHVTCATLAPGSVRHHQPQILAINFPQVGLWGTYSYQSIKICDQLWAGIARSTSIYKTLWTAFLLQPKFMKVYANDSPFQKAFMFKFRSLSDSGGESVSFEAEVRAQMEGFLK